MYSWADLSVDIEIAAVRHLSFPEVNKINHKENISPI